MCAVTNSLFQAFLTKGRSGILDSSIPTYWSIVTPSFNTRALVTLMRNAIWRERDIWLSNHADIEATINNGIEHFLYAE